MDVYGTQEAGASCMERLLCSGPLQLPISVPMSRPDIPRQASASRCAPIFGKKYVMELSAKPSTSSSKSSNLVPKASSYSNRDIVYAGDNFAYGAPFAYHGDVCYRYNPGKCLKRKTEDDSSMLLPVIKQHITEEKMAESMQNLSLDNPLNLGSVKQLNDDSDFEDDSDIDEDTDIREQSIDPVFELHVDLQETFKTMRPILPDSILNDMARLENTSMAVVPYVPRDAIFLRTITQRKSEMDRSQEKRLDDRSNDDSDPENEMDVIYIDS